jgi:hypothetical protein
VKRVLLIQYHFLPAHNVSVRQFLGYCKYLPESGWEPTILTRPWGPSLSEVDRAWGVSLEPAVARAWANRLTIHAVGPESYDNLFYRWHERLKHAPRQPLARVARKALSPFAQFFGQYPDPFVGWIKPAIAEALALHRERPFDAILASCPPETNLLVANAVAAETGLPFLAFFGDLYGYFLGEGGFHHGRWRKAVAHWQRRRWSRQAKRALAVSPYMVEYLKEHYGLPGELAVVGFDDSDHAREITSPKNSKLTLSHLGSIYPGHQRPELLFDALDRLLRSRPDATEHLEIRLIGSKCESWLENNLKARPCRSLVQIRPKVSPEEAVAIEAESHALLAFNVTGFGKSRTLSYPSKIFEYFGARRRILAIPSDQDWVESLLNQTGAGVSASDPEQIAALLTQWLGEWETKGALEWAGDANKTSEFSHRRQAFRIGQNLDAIAVKR